MKRSLLPLAVVILVLSLAARAGAHPLSQGSLDITVHPDRLDVRARVSLEEVSVTNMLTTPDAPSASPTTGPAGVPAATGGYEQHAKYLVSHLVFTANGKTLEGKVVGATPPPANASISEQRPTYQFEYRLPPLEDGSAATLPADIQLQDTVLTDVEFLPGTKWEAMYVVRTAQGNEAFGDPRPLAAGQPIAFEVKISRWGMFKEYLGHGVHHIATGYDHLLFISALVLAATTLWDLLKVVTAFTLAHTITLSLAALNLVHVPSYIVEPLISLSIVVVALQNVFFPKRSRGWARLGAAFFFGLFHGLGFAGGLLEAMENMHGTTVLLAILAFSIGVEAGHQMIVLPLFAGLKIARQTQRSETARERVSLMAQRFGSAAISLAGMFYLFVALRESFAPAP